MPSTLTEYCNHTISLCSDGFERERLQKQGIAAFSKLERDIIRQAVGPEGKTPQDMMLALIKIKATIGGCIVSATDLRGKGSHKCRIENINAI